MVECISYFLLQCAGSSYYLSVDLQLFLIGLIVLHCFSRTVESGTIACILFTFISCLRIALDVMKHNVTGQMFVKNPEPLKINQYCHYITMAPTSYIPGKLIHSRVMTDRSLDSFCQVTWLESSVVSCLLNLTLRWPSEVFEVIFAGSCFVISFLPWLYSCLSFTTRWTSYPSHSLSLFPS